MSNFLGTRNLESGGLFLAIGAGQVSGVDGFIDKFGHDGAVGASYETTWEGSVAYPYLAVGEQLKISSDSAEDDPGGAGGSTGAHSIELQGHDTNHDIITEIVTLDGAGVVTTTKSFHRIFRARVLTAGSTNSNVGIISIKNNAADTTQALISAANGQTLMTTWTVPRDKRFYLTHWWAGESGNKSTTVGLFTREGAGHGVWNNKQTQIINNNEFHRPFPYPLQFDGPCDIEIRAKSVGGGGIVSAGFSGFWGKI